MKHYCLGGLYPRKELSSPPTLHLRLFSLSSNRSIVVKYRKSKAIAGRMKSKVKAMENFVTGWEIWLVNSMCLVASYIWHRLCDLLCYRRRHRASTPPAIQVYTRPFDLLNNTQTLANEPAGWTKNSQYALSYSQCCLYVLMNFQMGQYNFLPLRAVKLYSLLFYSIENPCNFIVTTSPTEKMQIKSSAVSGLCLIC